MGLVIILGCCPLCYSVPWSGPFGGDVIVEDSPSAVVHVTGSCGGYTFHHETHHGKPAQTNRVALFMIIFL